MCGIAGQLQYDRARSLPLGAIERANASQSHRGPDSAGIFQHGAVSLAHRRLKIFDLTEQAAQPMIDHQLGLALVFNGAIYNYKELRGELEAQGYRFVSDGDTEVLLKAYHAWGEAAIPRLRGMFAFAVWERDSDRLVIARDRMGIKPLYYAETRDGFRFASTLPALLEFPGIDTAIDPAALQYYLTFHAVPEPLTLIRGIRKLLPGSVMVVTAEGGVSQKRYWQLQVNENNADHSRSAQDWTEATRDALTLAIDRQLAADVPVGVLLSGGLDSSLLVALAAQMQGQKVETFSIGFESSHGEKGDEFYYSDRVAQQFRTQHHQLFIPNTHLTDTLADCVTAMSEPMVSHDNIGFYLLSHEVAKHVKVVLSGQGADELFAGYRWFQTMPNHAVSLEDSAAAIHRAVADRSYDEYAALVSPGFRTDDVCLPFLRELCRENGSASPLDNLIAYESGFALANGPLERVDNMTMAASLEARVPFLDEAVVELAAAMPMQHKLTDGGKAILKALARRYLPPEVVDRTKGYFPVPALTRLSGSTLDLMHEVLTPNAIRARGLFDPEAINALLSRPEEHLTPTGASKLWQIGLLEFWLTQHGL